MTLTLGGPDLAHFTPMGADQWCRMFFPRQSQSQLRLPVSTGNGWMPKTLLMGMETRPWVRNYTIRTYRAQAHELDIELVVHGDGPGSRFAQTAAPGDEVGIFDEGVTYLPPEAGAQLLVADESAVPAVLSILEGASDDLDATALLEVPSTADIRPVRAPAGVDVRWLVRQGPEAKPGSAVLADLARSARGSNPAYAWVAGESGLATGVRRLLVDGWGMAKTAISFTGYWKAGRSSLG